MRLGAMLVLVMLGLGCARPMGPPKIELGTECASCSMAVSDLRFACERATEKGWNVYDSIECMLRDTDATGAIALADYDTKSLHMADSLWVVHGSFPSPMGGGYAAFSERTAADTIAMRTHGEVLRIDRFLARAETRP